MKELDAIIAPVIKEFSLAEIARIAGLAPSYVHDIRSGKYKPRHATLARVHLAVVRIKGRRTAGSVVVHAIYRLALVVSSQAMGLDAGLVQTSDPALKSVASKDWLDAAQARRMAQYLLNTTLGFSQSEVAQASGVSKQAVSLAVREIEERRENDGFDDFVNQLERFVLGNGNEHKPINKVWAKW